MNFYSACEIVRHSRLTVPTGWTGTRTQLFGMRWTMSLSVGRSDGIRRWSRSQRSATSNFWSRLIMYVLMSFALKATPLNNTRTSSVFITPEDNNQTINKEYRDQSINQSIWKNSHRGSRKRRHPNCLSQHPKLRKGQPQTRSFAGGRDLWTDPILQGRWSREWWWCWRACRRATAGRESRRPGDEPRRNATKHLGKKKFKWLVIKSPGKKKLKWLVVSITW